jgi:hypothetical protein
MESAFSTIGDGGILGALVVVQFGAIAYLYKQIQSVQNKRLSDAVAALENWSKLSNQINGTMATLCELLKERQK